MDRPGEQDALSALQKAFSVLDAFTPSRPVMSVRELSRRSGIARSTTHRLVGELVEWGALERTEDGVRIGMKLFELGALASSQVGLREAALPFAHHLNELTGLTVNLAVRDGVDVVYIEKISTRNLRVPHSRLGGRGKIHATGLGKAILAFSPPEVLDAVTALPLEAVTSKTITDPAALRAELHRVRAAGVAYDVEESRLGLFCVAAPILGSTGEPIAAVSVTGATELSQAERFADVVRTVALAIGRSLSARPGTPRRA